jgi:ring-1,2-phenylacetyl-CoA epoxidase subunit PaaE
LSKQFYPLQVKDLYKDTENAVVVTFDVPDELMDEFAFIQGQYLTLNKEIDGEEVRRSYSICAGLDDGHLRVAIKHVEGGVFYTRANEQHNSGYIHEVMPPPGDFYKAI